MSRKDVKKVQLNLRRGSKPLSFTLYDSVESAFYLKDEPPYPDGFEEEFRKIIVLNPGDILEAEWIGSEWIFDDEESGNIQKRDSSDFDRYDKIRLGKITPLKGTTEKMGFLEVYSGWVYGGDVPWVDSRLPGGLKITRIKGKTVSKFDFTKLFLDPQMGLMQQEEDVTIGDVLN